MLDADLTRPQPLQVTVTGDGIVTSEPRGIDCGVRCEADFEPASVVMLTAVAEVGSAFSGWSGACSGTGDCLVTMDGAKDVSAEFAPHGARRWVSHLGFEGQDGVDRVAVDRNGDVIVLALVQVGDAAGFDLNVVKYSGNDGQVLWSEVIATTSGEYTGGLAVDEAGNVYVGGTIYGSNVPTMIGGTTVTPDLFGNIVVIRLAASSGDVEWVQQWGGAGQDRPSALAIAGEELLVVGESSSTATAFGSFMLSMSSGDAFIVRARTSDGLVLQARSIAGNLELRDVATAGGRLLLVGNFRAPIAFDGCSLTPTASASPDGMVLELSSSTLACRWARSFGDATGNDSASAAAAFPGGGWVVTGSFQGSVMFASSGSPLVSRGGFDVFAVRYEADGSHVWSFRYGDTGFDIGTGVAVTADGATILAGNFETTIQLGATKLSGARDVYLTRLSADRAPAHEWAVGLGGQESDLATTVAVDALGTPTVAASFTGMTVVAGTPLTAQSYDVWIASLVR